MESRYILGQQALTPDGAVYQIIMDEPYDESTTPDEVAQDLPYLAPEDTIAGSTCIFNTEDADGYPVEWLFAFDGTNWALDRVIRGGSAGGGGATFPTFTMHKNPSTGVTTWECDMTYADVSAVYDREALGESFSDCPCKYQSRTTSLSWHKMRYWTKQTIEAFMEDEGVTLDPALPATVVGGFVIIETLGSIMNFQGVYANDGNFYTFTSSQSESAIKR